MTGTRVALASVLVWGTLGISAGNAQTRRGPNRPNLGNGSVASPIQEQAKPKVRVSPAVEAIQKAAQDYAKAFNSRDFAAIADQWTSQAEMRQDNGAILRGRDAIMAAIKRAASHRPKATIVIAVESVDLLGAGAARVRGSIILKDEGEVGSWATRFSSLRVLEDGKWRLADTWETPAATSSIEDMAWLAGTWAAKSPLGQVTVTYEKTLGSTGLVGKISVKPDTGPAIEVLEVIQARDGAIRSWVFDSTGLFGEGYWEHDGARFNRTIHAASADGTPASSVIVLTRSSPDSVLWHPIERIRGANRLPDLPSIKLTKVK